MWVLRKVGLTMFNLSFHFVNQVSDKYHTGVKQVSAKLSISPCTLPPPFVFIAQNQY